MGIGQEIRTQHEEMDIYFGLVNFESHSSS